MKPQLQYCQALLNAELALLEVSVAGEQIGEPLAREAKTICETLAQRRLAIQSLINQHENQTHCFTVEVLSH